MNKKMIAFLTALTCMSALAALPASAELQVLPDGKWVDATTTPYPGIMVETDGTELTREMLSDIEGLVQIKNIVSYEEFTKSYPFWKTVVSVEPESKAYMLNLNETSPDVLIKFGRELMVTMDCIKETHLCETTHYRYPLSTNRFTVKTKEGIDLNEADIPEFADFTFYSSGIEFPEDGWNKWTVIMPTDTFSVMLRTLSEYEIYCYNQDFCEEILEKYPDIIESMGQLIKYNSTSNDNAASYAASSVWTSAGDSNSDGAVDASDAANVLNIAAQNGTGAAIKATAADDVNADGAVNANDAAAVLCYAAAKGTGADVSWVDILRR
ncbi:MAG: hypothetical protein E7502_05305 [Ruminococcus sp.]|nr:hypothetical protein [Ruminococcus sp.]